MPTVAPIVPARPPGVITNSPLALVTLTMPPARLSEPPLMPTRRTLWFWDDYAGVWRDGVIRVP